MKKIIYLFSIVLLVCSCNESYIDNLDHESQIAEVQNFDYTLDPATDYAAMASNKEAQEFALAADNDSTAYKNLQDVKTNKSFPSTDFAKVYLPFFLKYRMTYLTDGSIVSLGYKYRSSVDGKSINIDTVTTFKRMDAIWKPEFYFIIEPFDNSLGDFTIVDRIEVPEISGGIWQTTTQYGMKATAFAKPTNYAVESYLISPTFNFSKANAPTITFDHVSRYVTTADSSNQDAHAKRLLVLVSTDYADDVTTCTWDTIPYNKDKDGKWILPSGENWDFMSTEPMSLAAYAGQSTVTVALLYTSTAKNAGTWEVKNLIINDFE